MQSIVNRLKEIDTWIRENGFGSRGLHSASNDARELENALQTLLNARSTLSKWENTYHRFFIEKALKEYPELTTRFPERIRRFKGNWLNSSELEALFDACNNYIKRV